MKRTLGTISDPIRELIEAGWELSHDPVRTTSGNIRHDLLATSPSATLSLRSIREFGEPQRYVLTGGTAATSERRRWHLGAQAPHPAALTAAIRAAGPSTHPRAPLSKMLRASGWRVDNWETSGENVISYVSPPHCQPLRASFVTAADGSLPGWTIRLPYGHRAIASADIPGPVLSSFLLSTAAND